MCVCVCVCPTLDRSAKVQALLPQGHPALVSSPPPGSDKRKRRLGSCLAAFSFLNLHV